MRRNGLIYREDISKHEVRKVLASRDHPYWILLSYGRHLGVSKKHTKADYWLARVRTKDGGYYQRRLGHASVTDVPSKTRMTFAEAVEAAREWFRQPEVVNVAGDCRPIGQRHDLSFSPFGDTFTVGHALHGYVEWKRLAAARTHFETGISLIECHLVQRLASLPISEFTGEVFKWLVREILETAPRHGRMKPGPRQSIASLDEDALRRRKKTVNNIVGILRLSFQLAWENGHLEDDRPLRCLRRLRVVDRPRTLHLSRDECRLLLKQCSPALARLVLGALYTGCRATELVKMKCNQVGRDGYGIYVEPLKTYRARFVFLPDEAMAWFLALIKGKDPHDLVFTRDDGTPWYRYKGPFKTAVRQARLPDEFTFHGLRHTYASQLVMAGTPVFAIADQLGHVDPATVLKTYGHLSPQIRESEVRQRFSTIDFKNKRAAKAQQKALARWRSRLHGKDWRTYAEINDTSTAEKQLRSSILGPSAAGRPPRLRSSL